MRDCKCSQNHLCEKCGQSGHFEICCKSKQTRGKSSKQPAGQDTNKGKKPPHNVRSVVPDKPDKDDGDGVDYYAFSTEENHHPGTLQLLVQDKSLDVIADSGASCNLMSAETFVHCQGGNSFNTM